MSNVINKALERYTKAVEAIHDHIKANKPVFDAHQQLVFAEIEAKEALTDAVLESKTNANNGRVRATYSPVFKRGYDGDFVMANASPKVKQALIEAGAVKYEIDAEKFNDLAEKGIIPVDLKQDAYREVEQKPRVTIREIKD